MIQFLIHEKRDTVGVAVVDVKAGQTLEGRSLDTNGVINNSQGFYFSVENKATTGFRINARNNNAGSLVTCTSGASFSFAVVPLP